MTVAGFELRMTERKGQSLHCIRDPGLSFVLFCEGWEASFVTSLCPRYDIPITHSFPRRAMFVHQATRVSATRCVPHTASDTYSARL